MEFDDSRPEVRLALSFIPGTDGILWQGGDSNLLGTPRGVIGGRRGRAGNENAEVGREMKGTIRRH